MDASRCFGGNEWRRVLDAKALGFSEVVSLVGAEAVVVVGGDERAVAVGNAGFGGLGQGRAPVRP